MASNKNAVLRYNVIDRCLSNFHKNHTLYSILDEVNEALTDHGYDGIKKRQLQEDIKFMESDDGFAIELEEGLKEGRKKILRYKEKGFSISEHPLNQLDIDQLKATLTILSRYKHREEFSWLNELIPRMEQAFKLVEQGQRGIISYQNNPDLVGMQWIGVLFNLIAKEKTALIEYQPYGKESNSFLIYPYHLKQYNNRWFLLCKTVGFETLSTYPLDRIKNVEESGEKYNETGIDWLDYFDEMIGVTKTEEAKSEKIVLRFSEKRINYVKTKPLHGTQKVLKSDPLGLTLQIEVIPNRELYQVLLSFGEDVVVLSPNTVKENIKQKISNMYDNY
jgi:predicted DNA-binding transcriptional regulator YafY